MTYPTTSCCPICKITIPAVKSIEGNNVFLSKSCPEHGSFKILISKDAQRFFDQTFSSPGKEVYEHQTKVAKGCPDDCGLCPDHKQHLCSALIEITNKCDLRCPVCYFGDFGQEDISFAEFQSRLATILRTENGNLDVLQISGGEPTLHPDFPTFLEYAYNQNITRILVNTNGLSILSDPVIFATLLDHKDKVEVYLQFDGFNTSANLFLRGTDLLQKKLEIIDKLNNANIKICLAVTVIPGNLSELKNILKLAIEKENITGVTFQRFTKTGCGEELTQPSLLQEDILQELADTGYLKYKHIVPLPCSHENCTSVSFLFVADGKVHSLGSMVDFAKHQHIIKNKIGFDSTILDYLKEQTSCCSGGCCSSITRKLPVVKKLRAFTEGKASNYKNMKILRIVVKNFMDATTFDTVRAQKCCVGVAVGDNKIIPFCVNNIFGKRNNADR